MVSSYSFDEIFFISSNNIYFFSVKLSESSKKGEHFIGQTVVAMNQGFAPINIDDYKHLIKSK